MCVKGDAYLSAMCVAGQHTVCVGIENLIGNVRFVAENQSVHIRSRLVYNRGVTVADQEIVDSNQPEVIFLKGDRFVYQHLKASGFHDVFISMFRSASVVMIAEYRVFSEIRFHLCQSIGNLGWSSGIFIEIIDQIAGKKQKIRRVFVDFADCLFKLTKIILKSEMCIREDRDGNGLIHGTTGIFNLLYRKSGRFNEMRVSDDSQGKEDENQNKRKNKLEKLSNGFYHINTSFLSELKLLYYDTTDCDLFQCGEGGDPLKCMV